MNHNLRTVVLAIFLALVALPSLAEQQLSESEQEKRAQILFTQLRCMVCEGQSIADSNALLATDMRRAVREQIAHGSSNQAVLDYLVERYGEYILMKPRLRASTYALWFAPPLLLLLGLFIIFRQTKGR